MFTWTNEKSKLRTAQWVAGSAMIAAGVQLAFGWPGVLIIGGVLMLLISKID